jgi:2-polyprenyl-3-methyl-5-hydroxy-6-metoxy-1,4-benzoquinol methylase
MYSSPKIEKEYFKITLEKFKTGILSRAVGNYTKAYETFKRIENIEKSFIAAIQSKRKVDILDVGCGDGYHICMFNTINGVKEKVAFTGIDMSDVNVSFASMVAKELSFNNVNFQTGSAEELGFLDKKFDVVICSDVVEHLKSPEKCLASILDILKPGGISIITTPNSENLIVRIKDKLFPRKTQIEIDNGEHISLKGLKEWINIARKTGFNVLNVYRGALIFGGPRYNRHPILFAFVILIDRIMDFIPFANNCGEAVTLNLRKPVKP